jgi:hypothetical protein
VPKPKFNKILIFGWIKNLILLGLIEVIHHCESLTAGPIYLYFLVLTVLDQPFGFNSVILVKSTVSDRPHNVACSQGIQKI